MKTGKWVIGKNGQPKAVILEEGVVEEITKRLWYGARIKVWRVRERIPGMGAPSTAGIPDLFGWFRVSEQLRPVPLFIEVKRPGGARRTAQIQFIDEAKAAGCVAFFAESWADCVKELKEHGIILPD